MKEDPIGLEGGINLFTYASNNPLKYIDPKGLSCGSKWTNWIVPDKHWGVYDFTEPCNINDKCYENLGRTQADCDKKFLKNMKGECKKLSGIWYYDCMTTAYIYYDIVRGPAGWIAYWLAQSEAKKKKKCD